MRELTSLELEAISGGADQAASEEVKCRTELVCKTDFKGETVCEAKLVCDF